MRELHESEAGAFTAKAQAAYVAYMEGGPVSLLDDAAFFERAAARVQPQAAPVKAQPVKRQRCAHYKTIQAVMSAARARGLDTTAKDRMRGAICTALGRRIQSRSEMSAADWGRALHLVEAGRLVW